ncbi:hypothetical protein TRIUR3_20169 [Triticum urartu]|uniref:Lipase-like C-terminal domain-containing protein n=1 Tax=Triticum urartu TaxID=4572 RepID=M7YIY5_TRIUA|nr:hypothetical protein TRIUR3_20169 [Triticum urartu]
MTGGARELFYYLKGGQVDYGVEHSQVYGHTRFGRIYETGHYPVWDEQNPVHFVGHSAGAQVVRVLHQMLAEKAFPGHDTSEDWVLSLTSLSGALNGTTRTYYDGMLAEDGRSMKSICLLQLCRLGVIVYDWLDIPWLKNYYNFGFDHFEMSWRKVGFSGLVDLLLGNTGPFSSGDWILPDLTIQGSLKINSTLKTFPNTFYFSYATKRTRKLFGITVPSSVLGVHPMLFLRVLQMCMWRHPQNAPLPYKGYRDEDWEDNDGALNTISMTHPRIPIEHPNRFVVDDSDCNPLQPGIWYHKIIEGDHILFIVNRERAGVQFDLLLDPSDLRYSSTAAIAVLLRWSYWGLARRLPDCLLQQVLPDSGEGGAMTAARLRLASVLVVVARCSMNLDVVFIISGVRCTAIIEDE